MMDVKDARKIIKDLSEKTFICSEYCIETESGYVITTKERQKYARSKKQTNADRIRNMTDEELAVYTCEIQQLAIDRNKADKTEDALQWLQSEVKEGNSNENT